MKGEERGAESGRGRERGTEGGKERDFRMNFSSMVGIPFISLPVSLERIIITEIAYT